MKNFISLLMIISLSATFLYAGEVKPIKPSPDDKCPVCGMFVAKYKNWTAGITFRDGTHAFFDGSKDMLKYYLNISAYDSSKKTSDIASVFVTEYYSTTQMPADKIFFVMGSNVYGPMGEELIPLATEKAAKEFMRDHMGKKILRFSEITLEVLK